MKENNQHFPNRDGSALDNPKGARKRLSRFRKPRELNRKLILSIAFVVVGFLVYLLFQSQPDMLTANLNKEYVVNIKRVGAVIFISGVVLLWSLLVDRAPG